MWKRFSKEFTFEDQKEESVHARVEMDHRFAME